MELFFAETGCGACIRAAKDEDTAYNRLLREVGTREGVSLIRPATTSDIAYVRSMGGYVPTLQRNKEN